jgi:RHS repeat-associated protein
MRKIAYYGLSFVALIALHSGYAAVVTRPPPPPLTAPDGVTALSGHVETTEGLPLPGVVISDGAGRTVTDENGRFIIANVSAGSSILVIDGRQTATAQGAVDYGYYEARINAVEGKTTILPFISYLPKIDHRHDVTISSPTKKALVVKCATIPGLELRIPAGAVITDPDGKPVTHIGITKIPIDRTPFPLPQNVSVPVYFTAQPGSARITSIDGKWLGAQVVYPNYNHLLPKARGTFWRYDPDSLGWTPYGIGTVTADARQVVPSAGTRIYNLTGAMFDDDDDGPPDNPPFPHDDDNHVPPPPIVGGGGGGGGGGGPPNGDDMPPDDGDPVDLSTGLFIDHHVDLVLGGVGGLGVSRTYRPGDYNSRSFGVGTTMSFEMYLWSANQYQEVDLIFPDGGRIHYTRVPNTPPSNGFTDAVFVPTGTPSAFIDSRITYVLDPILRLGSWHLVLANGTTYVFGDNAPLQYIQDRFGNRTTLTRAGGTNGPVTLVTGPDGRSISFTVDSTRKITKAQDDSGRTVTYTYDTSKRLSTVTDPNGGVTTYNWDASNRIASIEDANHVTYLTNTYDANDRVIKQTFADGTCYQFAYTLDSAGNVTETDVTDPRGKVRKLTFNSAGYTTSDSLAVGDPLEQDYTFTHDPVTNQLLSKTDALGRQTAWTYDTHGNVLSITKLAGTPQAVTTSFTYTFFNQVATVTDPLNQTTTFNYNALGELTHITDPRGYGSSFTYDGQGHPLTVTDALSNTTTFAYDHGILAAVTDPLNRTSQIYSDASGRAILSTDPLGNKSGKVYDSIYGIHSTTDANGVQVTTSYTSTGKIASIQDGRGGITSYSYDLLDRLATRTDPLNQTKNYTSYDANNNLLTLVDRKGQQVSYTYDSLNRLQQASYADGSVVTFGWDAGDRLVSIQDSVAGTVTRSYDGLNHLLAETTLQSSVSYIYDDDGRLSSSTVAGQPTVDYNYDPANRLTQITQGAAAVVFAYDNANRRTSVTYPNGVVASYKFDPASQLTEITYVRGGATVGTLTYDYDNAGRLAAKGGTLFQSILPATVVGGSYDADNRLTNWITPSGSVTPTYDNNGNMTNDGLHTFIWDARDRLIGITSLASFTYDPIGRRHSIASGGTTTLYVYDGAEPIQESVAGMVSANLLPGISPDERFTRASAGTAATFLTDALGSTVALTDAAGAVQTSYAYDPYGNTNLTGSATTSSYAYTGRESDGTGLYYYRARYYNPAWGRFISEDPIGLTGGVNLYQYAFNNPLQLKDPSGNCPGCKKVPGGGGGGNQGNGAPPDTPTGQRGNPMKIQRGTNSPDIINGRSYSGHAIDEMQSDGIVPSVVDEAVEAGTQTTSTKDASVTIHYSFSNNVSVAVGSDGTVITVTRGVLK